MTTYIDIIFTITIITTTILTIIPTLVEGTDKTLLQGLTGKDVINAAADKIESWCLLPDFRNLIKRIPSFELFDDLHQLDDTLMDYKYYGMWKIEKEQLDFVKSSLKGDLLEKIESKLSVKLDQVKLEDMEFPMIGATFAALTLYFRSNKVQVIPASEDESSKFFLNNYRLKPYASHPSLPILENKGDAYEVLFMVDGTNRVPAETFKSVITAMGEVKKQLDPTERGTLEIKMAFTQYTNQLKSSIDFTQKFDLNPSILKNIKQENTNVEGDVELALNGIKSFFRKERGIKEGTEEIIEGEGTHVGVARIAVLVTRSFREEDYPKIIKAEEALKQDHVNLIVFPIGSISKDEYARIGSLQNQMCKDSYLMEGFTATNNFNGYLSASIAQGAYVYVPIGRPVVLEGLSLHGNVKLNFEASKEGITIHIKLHQVRQDEKNRAGIHTTLYLSPTQIAPSSAYNQKKSVAFLENESVTSMGFSEYAKRHGIVKGLLTITHTPHLVNLQVTISTKKGNRDCMSKPCLNDGTCSMTDAGFVCKCTDLFEGKECQTRKDEKDEDKKENVCERKTCPERKICLPIDKDNIKCECKPGYTGDDCLTFTKSCDKFTCQNGGTCVQETNSKVVCTCMPSYSGNNCEIKDVCERNNCDVNQICIPTDKNNYKCECKPGYTGGDCSTLIKSCDQLKCQNGGTCVKADSKVVCKCLPSYSGNTCDIKDVCERNNCDANQICIPTDKNNYKCECKPGYTGDDCSTLIKTCDQLKCQNGGTCVEADSKVVCKCLPSYSGNTCEIKAKKGGAGELAPPLVLSIILVLCVTMVVF